MPPVIFTQRRPEDGESVEVLDLPTELSRLQVRLAVEPVLGVSWPVDAVFYCQADLSLDGGVTWQFFTRDEVPGPVLGSADKFGRPRKTPDGGKAWVAVNEDGSQDAIELAWGITAGPIDMKCATCGRLYIPGDVRYTKSLLHCDLPLIKSIAKADVAEAFAATLTKIPQSDWDGAKYASVFHTPTPDPASVRQVRVSYGVLTGEITSVLSVSVI